MVYYPHGADGTRQAQNHYPPPVYNVTSRARNAAPVAARRALGLFSRIYILRAPAHGAGIRPRAAAAFPAHGGMVFRLEAEKRFGGERNLYFRSGFLSPPSPLSLPARLRAAALRTRKATTNRLSSPDKYAFGTTNSLSAFNKHVFGTPNSLPATDKHVFGATNSLPATDKHEFGAQDSLSALDKYKFGATNSLPATNKYEFGATNSLSALDKDKFGAQNALSAFDKNEFGVQDESAGFPARTPTHPETIAAYAAAEQYGKGAFL